jgi:amidohydrolase
LDILDKIRASSKHYAHDIIKIRRLIHQYPELSFQEFKTSKYIYETLKSLKLDSVIKFPPTGVVALLNYDGSSHKKCVGLRADIDALPLTERTDLPFESKNPGIMHACGHDAHTAMLLGAAMILSDLIKELTGCVKFIFQPGEEKNPGGASILIKHGVLKNPGVDVIFGQHLLPNITAGKFGFCPGIMMASQDEIYITVIGKSGHASQPHKAIDPIVVASQVVLAIQNISSRYTNPYEPLTISIGKIEGGSATNIIPQEVKLSGTVRALNSKHRKKTLGLIERTVKGITSSAGAKYKFEISHGYPELVNDKNITSFSSTAAVEYAGAKNVFISEKMMTAEDFSYYLKRIPGTFYWIGAGNTTGLHTPTLNIDESILPYGAGFMAYLAWKYLEGYSK